MPAITVNKRVFDARPDRIDLRDRLYQPQLESLPDVYPSVDFVEQHLASYPGGLVLNQGNEGACTGFGLAATINFLLWRKNQFSTEGLTTVSPRMLYHLARIYDEWPGEDYSGSSCRGAMRGWHRHGVCSNDLWPYRNPQGRVKYVPPEEGWDVDAGTRPLGAYYRIQKDSIADMQAAIAEVGAIYASAQVHKGWFIGKTESPEVIDYPAEKTGGHAFVIGGYNADGFLVQNSWGPDWGYKGFAFLSYSDWVENGADAWVAVLGAPMRVARSASTFSSVSWSEHEFGKSSLLGRSNGSDKAGRSHTNSAVEPQSEEWAYQHSLVIGNNGMPLNKLVTAENAEGAIETVCQTMPDTFFASQPGNATPKLAIYVHGGLNSEEDSVKRVRVMGPYFKANGIHPIFITWRTGLMESLKGVVADSISDMFGEERGLPQESIFDSVRARMADARDRTIEVACENLLVKPLWSEMKQNADSAASEGGGVYSMVQQLLQLKSRHPNLQVHLIGHSAGSIVLGHFLTALKTKLKVDSVSLYAPACTVEFANTHYIAASKRGVYAPDDLHVDNMNDEREKADSVGPYGKSLLYLVSRALESRHKTPLLGMSNAWQPGKKELDQWHDNTATRKALTTWGKFVKKGVKHKLHGSENARIDVDDGVIPLAHGSFDNDIDVVGKTLRRIRGRKLRVEVDRLHY